MVHNPHRQAALVVADSWMNDPARQALLAKAYWLTRQESLEITTLREVFGQPYGGWDMGQLVALACLDHMVTKTFLVLSELHVGDKPRGDRFRKENQAALNRLLPPGTSVEVDPNQHAGEMDGWIDWASPIPFTAGDGMTGEIEAGGAPLEIGHTDATTTCLHLCRHGAVARWAYGHRKVQLLTTHPRDLINAVRIEQSDVDDEILQEIADFANIVWSAWWGLGPVSRRRRPSRGSTAAGTVSHGARRLGSGPG